MNIPHCYDSHVHWSGYGDLNQRLCLKSVRGSADLKNLNVTSSHYRESWLLGYGWSLESWQDTELPSAVDLDQVFGTDFPILFMSKDAHCFWLNSKALELCKITQTEDTPVGLCFDDQKDRIKKHMPPLSGTYLEEALRVGAQMFLRQGITHIRDMEGSLKQWEQAIELCDKKALFLAVESFFHCGDVNEVGRLVKELKHAKSHRPQNLRVGGIKIFCDGSLGSGTAYLSEDYKDSDDPGLFLLSDEEIKEVMSESWNAGLEVAVHTIGDQAAHEVVLKARELWSKKQKGILNLEHVQLLRPETVALMPKEFVRCHLQPCHFLSDQEWLDKKLSSPMTQNLFRWADLEKARVPFYFGSDTPIEPCGIFLNQKGYEVAVRSGIAPLKKPFLEYCSHPDPFWIPDTVTAFDPQGQVTGVNFNGQKLSVDF